MRYSIERAYVLYVSSKNKANLIIAHNKTTKQYNKNKVGQLLVDKKDIYCKLIFLTKDLGIKKYALYYKSRKDS